MAINWTCPQCGRLTTIQSPDISTRTVDSVVRTARQGEGVRFRTEIIKCPNRQCGELAISVAAHFHDITKDGLNEKYIDPDSKPLAPVGPGKFQFAPRVAAPLSKFVPDVVKTDYEEASMIADISPKAAATLCRRALQGMIRDFWCVSKNTLARELEAIEDKCDPAVYAAMMGLKAIGNIGAHPERDIALIVDVEPEEVQQLLGLIQMLDKDWYVARAGREQRLASIVALAAKKSASQTPT